jgi:hypothetical protein
MISRRPTELDYGRRQVVDPPSLGFGGQVIGFLIKGSRGDFLTDLQNDYAPFTGIE